MSKCFLPYLIYMIHPLCVISFCSFFCVEFVEFVSCHFQVPNQKFTSSSQDLVTKKWPSMEQSCYVPCFSIMTNLLMDDWSSNITHFLLLDNFCRICSVCIFILRVVSWVDFKFQNKFRNLSGISKILWQN